jgi:adenine-specific DNA methylase
MKRPRLLIEEWLPAAAIGVECIRERSTGQQPPDKRLHVWWARRPLAASRAAVLGSLLPADFPRDVFERLMGFWGSSADVVRAQQLLDWAKANKTKVPNPHGERAFKQHFQPKDLAAAHDAAVRLWGGRPKVIDPMAGGGSIPLESARLGFDTAANEYNPVACVILEATVDYPFRYGKKLGEKARKWGAELGKRFNARVERFYPKTGFLPPHCYIFARTVPCPDTQHHTPLVPDWHLLRPSGEHGRLVAEPMVNKAKGTWNVRIRQIGRGAGQLREAPRPTYGDGKGISLFTGLQIPSDYIKAKAQQGEMSSALYAVAIKTPQGLKFQPPEPEDIKAIEAAERALRNAAMG